VLGLALSVLWGLLRVEAVGGGATADRRLSLVELAGLANREG
jgi:hypothetical protein